MFRTCGRDDAQGRVAGDYIAAHFKGKPVAIVHDKTAYGKGLADETKKAMNAAGMKEAMYEFVNQGDKDFSALVSKMKQANIAAIYLRRLLHRGRAARSARRRSRGSTRC